MRESLWLPPAAAVVLAIAAGLLSLEFDSDIKVPVGVAGTPESTRLLLSTIAGAMITFTGLVFSITVVALQLASSQFSPRVLRGFLRDGHTKVALSLFVATFIFALIVASDVSSTEPSPELSISVAIILVVASLFAFVAYIDHMAQSIRAVTVIRNIGEETREAIEATFPESTDGRPVDEGSPAAAPAEGPGREWAEIASERSGVVLSVDTQALVELARDDLVEIEVLRRAGEFVAIGTPLGRARSEPSENAHAKFAQAIVFGPERVVRNDPAFGLRQLVDIAARALSPGVNDPSTATQAMDQIEDLLIRMGRRELPPAGFCDESGRRRVRVARSTWEELVQLAVEEIAHYGAEDPQVRRRLEALLESLAAIVHGRRREAVEARLGQLKAASARKTAPAV